MASRCPPASRLRCAAKAATSKPSKALRRKAGLSRLQQAFHEKLGAQCGFCTPGMIMAAEALAAAQSGADRGGDHGPRSPAISAAAPATPRSSNPCRQPRTWHHDRGAEPQGRPRSRRRSADRRHRQGHRAGALHGGSRPCRRAGRPHPAQSDQPRRHRRHRHQQGAARSTASWRSSPARIARSPTACCRSP